MPQIKVRDAQTGALVDAALIPNTGKAAATASLPVTLASDETLPLPAGAATAANQATAIAALAAVVTAVDGVEANQATANSSLAAIVTAVDGLEAAASTTNSTLATIAGHVDGLESATGAQDAAAAAADGTGNYSLIAAAKRALLNWAALLSRLPAALVAGRLAVVSSVPHVSAGVIMSAQTQAIGTSWTAFASQACIALDIVNNTGTTIEYRRGAAGTAMQIPTGAARMVIGITNANQIDLRRTDTSNTQVTVQAEAFQH